MTLPSWGITLSLWHEVKKKLGASAKKLKDDYNVKVETISQDLGSPEATDQILKFLQERNIFVGILVNNAGFAFMEEFHKIPREVALNMTNSMCLGSMDMTHELIPDMLQKGSGAIIFISSPGINPPPYFSTYNAAKAYIFNLALTLHEEYTKEDLDILAVAPGGVDTNFWHYSGTKWLMERLTPPEEVSKKSLKALGKSAVLIIPPNFIFEVGRILSNFMTFSLREKVMLRMAGKGVEKE